MFDWNDICCFLAVARNGSTLSASRSLRISQATVSRRVTVLEQALGVQLFVRGANGYALSERGRAVLASAEAIEAAAIAFEEGVKAEGRRLSGRVLLTTVESAATSWVIPALAKLRDEHPEISVELVTTDGILDLNRGDADIAIRFGRKPTQESLIVRHLADLDECFYASRELVMRLGRPTDYADLARYPMVAYGDDRLGEIGEWIAEHIPDAVVAQRANALSTIIASVKAGLGAAVLPSIMGDALKNLVRLLPPIPPKSRCWLVTTDAARRQPHVRAVIDRVVEQVESFTRPAALGEPPARIA